MEKVKRGKRAAATTKILGFIAVGVLFALGIGLFIARAIGKPLRDMQFAAEKLALGDVNVNVELTPGMNWALSPIRSAP